MGELVRQHAIQVFTFFAGASHRHANDAVERRRRPLGRTRNVAELFAAIQHDRDGPRREGAEDIANPPVGTVQRVERLGRHAGILLPLERHREEIADGESHAAVQVGLPLPSRQRVAHASIARHFRRHHFVESNGLRQVALALGDLSKLRASAGQAWCQHQRLLERRFGNGIAAEHERGGAQAQVQAGVLGIEGNRIAEGLLGSLRLAGIERGPRVLLQHGSLGAALRHRELGPKDQRESDGETGRGHLFTI